MSDTRNTSTETQHTPGPWRVDGCYIRAGDVLIADLFATPWRMGEKVHNARLMAAAPELLKKLEAKTRECREWQEAMVDLIASLPFDIRQRICAQLATVPAIAASLSPEALAEAARVLARAEG